MKIKFNSTNFDKAKNLIKKTVKKTIDMADDTSSKVKDIYQEVKQKTEPVVGEAINTVKMKLSKPKLETLQAEIKELERKCGGKKLGIEIAQKVEGVNPFDLYQQQKELALMEAKLSQLTKSYNEFVSRQQSAQEAFERLNRF